MGTMVVGVSHSHSTRPVVPRICYGIPSTGYNNIISTATISNNIQVTNMIITNGKFTISASASASASGTTASAAPTHGGQPLSISPTAATTEWSEFAKNVSGEWDGYGAEFCSQGKPVELPESVVPESYREWEVRVFDWQTQCPTLALPHDFVFNYKSIKLLPTAGCEADAATKYSVDERNIIGAAAGGNENSIDGCDSALLAFAYHSGGNYTAVFQHNAKEKDNLMELEHCLVDPDNRESRVRISQFVRQSQQDCIKLVLEKIRVFCEQWYGPFRDGEQLGGCALRSSAFAATDALKTSQVNGSWQGLHAVANFRNSPNNIIQPLVDDGVREEVRNEADLIMLPNHLWCSLKERDGGGMCCEVGWLLQHGSAITSRCIFSTDAELKEIEMVRARQQWTINESTYQPTTQPNKQ